MSEDLINDRGIIQQVLAGDREAYAGLVRAYHTRVLNLCLSFMLNLSEAEDAAQDAFVKAYASLKTIPPGAPFLSWVCRIASNHCLDLLRKRKRQKTSSLDAALEAHQEGAALDKGLISPEIPPAEPERLEAAVKALAQLPPDYRQILVLRELNELSYEDIAAALGCSLDAVKAKLRRARQGLQEKARHFLSDEAFSQ